MFHEKEEEEDTEKERGDGSKRGRKKWEKRPIGL